MPKQNQSLTKSVTLIENSLSESEMKTLPKGFCLHLFSGIEQEELDRFSPETLAKLAVQTYKNLFRYQSGESLLFHKQQVFTQADGKIRPVTLITLINDNMAFLVNSITAEFISRSLEIQFLAHPVFTLQRGKDNRLTTYGGIQPPTIGAWSRESVIIIAIDEIEDKVLLQSILDSIQETSRQVRAANRDWKPMIARIGQAIASYESNSPKLAESETTEAVAFLRWLRDDHFTFLGMREYRFERAKKEIEIQRIDETALGILSDPNLRVLRKGRELVTITPEMQEFLHQPTALIVTKASLRSRIHRRVHLDYIGVKLFDEDSKLVGELRIVGLFTSDAYSKSVRSIPYIRRKVDVVLSQTGFDPAGHSGKALLNVLENYPRDELFQIDADLLSAHAQIAMGIKTRPHVKVLSRIDKFDRYASILVYVPRDQYGTKQRLAIGDYLANLFDGHISAVYPDYPEVNFARVHYIIGRYEGKTPNPAQSLMEKDIAALCRNWSDLLREELLSALPPLEARQIFRTYQDSFSAAYQETYPPKAALADIQHIKNLEGGAELDVELHRDVTDQKGEFEIKVFHADSPSALTRRVPMLEAMGFSVVSERTYTIKPSEQGGKISAVYLHDMKLTLAEGDLPALESFKDRVEEAYCALATGQAEADGFNGLIMSTDLDWQKITVFRAIGRFLRQAALPYSQDYLWNTLRAYPQITRDLFTLFDNRFNPKLKVSMSKRQALTSSGKEMIEKALNDVSNLDQDRILRSYLRVILACVRTNVYQSVSEGRQAYAFKIKSRDLDFLPAPRPLFEIFVYSPRVEGVHLRFGKVARGGLRWSDRLQDFRTEVLGLVKAQQSKNAVIVPVGSKGGFVPQRLPSPQDRQAWLDEGVACYKIFVDSLLSLTDNLDAEGKTLPPASVIRHDEDDPYLVVAADKGTATFSDIANAISEARGFWLGDAFASGGSAGYDHKVMGITARGAWEAVKRHFREMNHDIQTQPFTAVGVGDMSGDVFGNGMLLSEQTRLIAAFDHRDIFIDPNPDTAQSYQERKRLFGLGRSSWQDYDRSLISRGGGIFSRTSKSIAITPEMAEALDLKGDKATPDEVMRAILTARADLLWFGGIGTYVCASDESNDRVGDRANDVIRVFGANVRARVIGEGANLGITQRGRVEFAEHGGAINTDAIDNSAGVNSSDLEVNIKIALGTVVRSGRLTIPQRNALLSSMTNDVARLVLSNNYLQTMSLTQAQTFGRMGFQFQRHLMRFLEEKAGLDRAVEFMPDEGKLARRAERAQGLTRPEIAVLLAYAKNDLYARLLRTDIPDDPYFEARLISYFPSALAKSYREDLLGHRLRREIIATVLANAMLNYGGPAFEDRLRGAFNAPLEAIARAFVIAFDALGIKDHFALVHGLDSKVPGALQVRLYRDVADQLYSMTGSLLRNKVALGSLAEAVELYATQLKALKALSIDNLGNELADSLSRQAKAYEEDGLASDLALALSDRALTVHLPGLVMMARQTSHPLESIARPYFSIASHFGLAEIARRAQDAETNDYFDRIALDRALDSIEQVHQMITMNMLEGANGKSPPFDNWLSDHRESAERVRSSLGDLFEGGRVNLSRLVLAQSLFREIS